MLEDNILEIIRVLSDNHILGMSHQLLAAEIGVSETELWEFIRMLLRHGWVLKGDDSRWRLSPTFGGIAGRIMRSYQEAKLRLTEEEARYAVEMQ